jgi:hypothetical protein
MHQSRRETIPTSAPYHAALPNTPSNGTDVSGQFLRPFPYSAVFRLRDWPSGLKCRRSNVFVRYALTFQVSDVGSIPAARSNNSQVSCRSACAFSPAYIQRAFALGVPKRQNRWLSRHGIWFYNPEYRSCRSRRVYSGSGKRRSLRACSITTAIRHAQSRSLRAGRCRTKRHGESTGRACCE